MVSQKAKARIYAFVTAAVLAVMAAFTVGFASSGVRAEDVTPVYRLEFADAADRGKNTGSVAELPSAQIVSDGGITYGVANRRGAYASVVNSTNEKVRQNYIVLPNAAMNRESATVTGWFYVDSGVHMWSRMLEIDNGKSGDELYRVMIMPYHGGAYNGLNVGMTIAGVLQKENGSSDNLFFGGKDSDCPVNMPLGTDFLPLYNGWVHYAYEFSPTAFKIYINGKPVHEKAGDFSASHFYGENGRFWLGATGTDDTRDFTGRFADIRVYDKVLGSELIKSEYGFEYSDFLTASYDFENGVTDGARGFDGILTGSASIAERDGGHVLVVDGGQANKDVPATKSGFVIPGRAIHGHNELTVSADIKIDGSTSFYSYLFYAGSTGSNQCMTGLAVKFGSASASRLKFTKNGDLRTKDLDTQAIPFDKWVNVTFVLDGKAAVIYVDGSEIARSADLPYSDNIFWDNLNNNELIGFGRTIQYNDAPIKAEYDNIKIYNKALTAKEVGLSSGLITIIDDSAAVSAEKDKLNVSWDGVSSRIELPSVLNECVSVAWNSSDPEVITAEGSVLPKNDNKTVILTATLSRGDVTMTKDFEITVPATPLPDLSLFVGTELSAVKFESGSYYEELMKTNLDFMMKLDKDRLLYNYRRIAGLDTQGKKSYGAWISTQSGGAGQFESHYVVALAKAAVTMPEYRYNGESVLDRLTYMVTELKKCQDAFAVRYPNDAGYMGAFTTDCFTALEEGRNTTVDGTNIWVPWYMCHKNGEMLLDVATYAPVKELRDTAWEMLMDYAEWCSMRTSRIDETTRTRVLRTEYGGMSELFYQIYGKTRETKHWNVAKFFEEKPLLDNVYNNRDTLTNLHANTTIPKFLGAAAAYELTDDEYYKTVCLNAFDMIMTRVYANGSTSRGEHWQEPGQLLPANDTSETCCSYNMLKLADYLYRWTGDKKYADYFENVYTNHILASMAPDTGLKTYLTNSAFGFYKIYHTVDNSFWCCSCTGMESFAKLPYGIYYKDKSKNSVRVNMFYPSEYAVDDTLTIKQSGDFYTDQKTMFTVLGSGRFTLALRKPDWAADGQSISVKINGTVQTVEATAGYYELDREWTDGDTVEYAIEFAPRLDKLLGSERTYALMYGPLLYVADLGNDNVEDVQGSQLTFGTGYTGDIINLIALDGTLENCIKPEAVDDTTVITLKTANQGDLTFVPFNRIFHNRYGMYFDYFDSVEEAEKDYTVNGNEVGDEFDRETDITAYGRFNSLGYKVSVENGELITPVNGETKVMAKLALSGPYVMEIKIKPYTEGGALNSGVYVLASAAQAEQDKIKGYNVQVEREANSSIYSLNIFKFDNRYDRNVASVSMVMPENEIIELHVFVTEDKVSVFVNGRKAASVSINIDKDFITETFTDVGLRTNNCRSAFDGLRVISPEFEAVGKRVLSCAVREGNTVSEDECTPESYATFAEAFIVAKTVLDDATATQAQVNAANSALRAAFAALVMHADPAQLLAFLETVKAMDLRVYSAASVNTLKDVVRRIESVDTSKLAKSVIDGYISDLQSAVIGLKPVQFTADRLAAEIAAAEQLDETEYTEQSWSVFVAALEKAKTALPTAPADEDAAVIELLQARAMLVAKTPATPTVIERKVKGGLNGLSIAAIVVGSVAIAAVLALGAVYFVGKKKKGSEQ